MIRRFENRNIALLLFQIYPKLPPSFIYDVRAGTLLAICTLVYYDACLIIYAHFENSLFGSILKKMLFSEQTQLSLLIIQYDHFYFESKVLCSISYHNI